MIDATLIELLVAPSVLIPAGALLAMSTSARLSAILARVRDLHQRRADLFAAEPGDHERASRVRRVRLDGLERQAHELIGRAALTRTSLLLAYGSIAALLLSSSMLGVAVLWPPAERLALVLFFVGLLVLTASVAFAMLDVRQSLRWVRYEHERVASLDHRHDPPT